MIGIYITDRIVCGRVLLQYVLVYIPHGHWEPWVRSISPGSFLSYPS